jgi:hypothetical protein
MKGYGEAEGSMERPTSCAIDLNWTNTDSGVPFCLMPTGEIIFNILTIVAIIGGPIIALDIQRRLDRGREIRNRKLWIFKTLMSYRATALAPNFVQALNLIDVEFDANTEKERSVRNAWKILLDHFGDLARVVPPNSSEKTAELTTRLLLAMGNSLGYDFDEVQIKKGAYYPMGLGNVEQEQHAVRRGILDVLTGKRRIPVGMFQDAFPPITLPMTQLNVEEPLTPDTPPLKKLPG